MKLDKNNAVFRLAADFINQTSEHVFLTGKAGTGKTTFLKYIRVHTHKNAVVADQIYVYSPDLNEDILVPKEEWENMCYSLNKEVLLKILKRVSANLSLTIL
jgi:ATPase subunit of ABC transporter with duplicated ATPase domains